MIIFRYLTNTDETLQQVRIVKNDGSLHGVLNWFSIHTTSMNMTNHLISSDNLGYASIRMEKTLNPGKPTGHVSFNIVYSNIHIVIHTVIVPYTDENTAIYFMIL